MFFINVIFIKAVMHSSNTQKEVTNCTIESDLPDTFLKIYT